MMLAETSSSSPAVGSGRPEYHTPNDISHAIRCSNNRHHGSRHPEQALASVDPANLDGQFSLIVVCTLPVLKPGAKEPCKPSIPAPKSRHSGHDNAKQYLRSTIGNSSGGSGSGGGPLRLSLSASKVPSRGKEVGWL